jgi:hypothetical protein
MRCRSVAGKTCKHGVVIDLSRAEDAFRYGELTYLVHREGGAVDRASPLWGDALEEELAGLGRPDPELLRWDRLLRVRPREPEDGAELAWHALGHLKTSEVGEVRGAARWRRGPLESAGGTMEGNVYVAKLAR